MALVSFGHVGGVGGVLAADDTPPMRGDPLAAAPADGPASLRFGQRPDHNAPIPVITMPILLITIDRSA
jgi:hypothetical protein